jgi:hypothetical protein
MNSVSSELPESNSLNDACFVESRGQKCNGLHRRQWGHVVENVMDCIAGNAPGCYRRTMRLFVGQCCQTQWPLSVETDFSVMVTYMWYQNSTTRST